MNHDFLRSLLDSVAAGKTTSAEALSSLSTLPFEDLGFARVDHHRTLRSGFPETIFCPGKSAEQVAQIAKRIWDAGENVLATRAGIEQADALRSLLPEAQYDPVSRVIRAIRTPVPKTTGVLGICAAGTADLPVAEECRLVADTLGTTTTTFYDVGVAGLHRLLAVQAELRRCKAVVVAAGMDGALPSVVGGLLAVPVIGVPTSVGYGANLGGLAPLTTMLNSCSPNVCVVNIDNGFGAAVVGSLIVRQGT